jgi:type 1 glutamine amidotransferase
MHKILLSAVAAIALTVSAGSGVAQERAPRDPNAIPVTPGQNVKGMHIYIRSGLKSHGEGFHDYPQFLADWSKFLTDHGAVVDGSFHAPTSEELAHTDVLLLYKGDAGYMTAADRSAPEAYVKRGGAIVSIHDSLCGPDPAYFAGLVGGAKLHTDRNSIAGPLTYTVDPASPIMKGMANFHFDDEAFYNITWAKDPAIHPLATVVLPAGRPTPPGQGWNNQPVGTPNHTGEVVPQIWTYEHTVPGGQPSRAFVYMQGHTYTNFANPLIQNMLLRGIAWAARHPVDELVDYVPPPQERGRGPQEAR